MTEPIYATRNQLAGILNLSASDTLAVLVFTGFLRPVMTYKGMTYRPNSQPARENLQGVIEFDVEAVQAAVEAVVTTDETVASIKTIDPKSLTDEMGTLSHCAYLLKMSDTALVYKMTKAKLIEKRKGRHYPTQKGAKYSQFNPSTGFYIWSPKRLYSALTAAGLM